MAEIEVDRSDPVGYANGRHWLIILIEQEAATVQGAHPIAIIEGARASDLSYGARRGVAEPQEQEEREYVSK